MLLAALSGVAACDPDDSDAAGATGGSGSSASPSSAPSATASKASDTGKPGNSDPTDDVDGDGKGGDCGKPPTLPAGHTKLKVELMRDSSGFEAAEAKPHCTPNDWIYGAEKGAQTKHYVLPEGVKAYLALAAGPGKWKQVDHEQLSLHIDRCLAEEIGAPTKDYPKVKAPYGCFGNIYDVTLNAKGEVETMKEIWSV
ncbi:hypothetical protein GCM10010260_73470 [Streptomyces filipinensis]|uniref:Uncharacterized protein n=1 Tax=Streptomyces filipinensis TaxID=66887 RepID=A0A918IJ07_9ACTN|nr:hypothetical protein [Streptomyces filipinensis]GGV22458.1 hypothetical protein GCM10010260_73470 [Streptomyces filipinensis]